MGIEELVKYYRWTMHHKADHRVANWQLMSSPLGCLLLVSAYLIFVWLGPKVMALRKAFSLTGMLVVYNASMVFLSLYMFLEFGATTILNKNFNLFCSPVDYSSNALATRLTKVCWWYFFSKAIELMDTVFIVLRKKNNQITFLHVYHHSTMLILWWFGVKFVPGGASYFSAMMNCFIHVLMYTYYCLSAFGPSMQKYLWWKKYMTVAQLAQFWAIIFYMTYVYFANCGYPTGYTVSMVLYILSHVLLFSNFYQSAYKQKNIEKPSGSNTNHLLQDPAKAPEKLQ